MPRTRHRHTADPSAAGALARDSAVPLYHQLALRLEGELASGRFATGERYYSDRELVERFGISLLTARQAVSELVRKRLVERRQGSGSYVGPGLPAGGVALDTVLFAGWGQAAISSWEAMYFRDIHQGLCAEAARRGLRVVFDDPSVTGPEALLAEIRRARIRGAVVLLGDGAAARATTLAAAGLRVATVNCEVPGVPSVRPDDHRGATAAFDYLWSLGHRAFVHLNSGEASLHWREVRRAYEDRLLAHGLPPADHPVLVAARGCGSIDAGYDLACQLLTRPVLPSAVIAGNDLMAIGAMRALLERGLAIPGRISVIGFDDIEACAICTPALTTVAADRAALGALALARVLEPGGEQRTQAPVGLRLRASVGPPPG